MRGRRAFTLVEMLVALAVFALAVLGLALFVDGAADAWRGALGGLVVGAVAGAWGASRAVDHDPRRSWPLWLRGVPVALGSALLVALAGVKIVTPLSTAANEQLERKTLPVGAVEWIAENRPAGEMFNHYNWGGYLIWKLWPEHRVFVDGRTDLYGDEILREYMAIQTARPDALQLLDAYGVSFVLTGAHDALSDAKKLDRDGAKAKNAVTFLGHTLHWDEFASAVSLKDDIIVLAEDDGLSNAVITRLLAIERRYRRDRQRGRYGARGKTPQGGNAVYYGPWMWQQTYALARLGRERHEDVQHRLVALQKRLVEGAQITQLGLAARWAQWLIRRRSQHGK